MTRPTTFPDFPSRAEIEWHVANGRRLRAEAVAAGTAAFGGWIRQAAGAARHRLATRASGSSGTADTATTLRAPLTAIRSTAEILHDNPDLSPAERTRFLRALLDEEQRLERLVAALTPSRSWRLTSR